MTKKVLGHEVFSPERLLNQPRGTLVCIRSMNQSNRSISVCLLCLFSSRVFISRPYENRSVLWRMLKIPFLSLQISKLSEGGYPQNCTFRTRFQAPTKLKVRYAVPDSLDRGGAFSGCA